MASQYRLKRGPVIGLILIVGTVGALLLARHSVRPTLDVSAPLTVPAAYDGTAYAFDGLVCVSGSSVGASVTADDGTGTRIGLRPPGSPVLVAFPARPDAVTPLRHAYVPAGEELCTRLLVSPRGRGRQAAPAVTLHFSYGPFGLLRSTTRIAPPVTFQVSGVGADPRGAAVG